MVIHIMFIHSWKKYLVYAHTVQDQANLVIHCMFIHTLLFTVLTVEFSVYLAFFLAKSGCFILMWISTLDLHLYFFPQWGHSSVSSLEWIFIYSSRYFFPRKTGNTHCILKKALMKYVSWDASCTQQVIYKCDDTLDRYIRTPFRCAH